MPERAAEQASRFDNSMQLQLVNRFKRHPAHAGNGARRMQGRSGSDQA
jgi:hypothetical protein